MPVYKYVDNTTLTELLQNTPAPKCQLFLSKLLSWANDNNMEMNTTKGLPRWVSWSVGGARVQSPGRPVDFVFGFQGRML